MNCQLASSESDKRFPTDVKKIRDHSLANEEGTKVYVPTQSATNPKDISIWEEVSYGCQWKWIRRVESLTKH